MYDKRIRIFIIVSVCLLLVCLLRLTQMQLLPDSSLQHRITELKLQRGRSQLLKTVRGKILDRKATILAADVPQLQLCISYHLCCFLDERVQRGKLLKAARQKNTDTALGRAKEEIKTKLEDLQQIIDKCTYFGLERADVENRIKNINNEMWNLRAFLAWVRNGPDPGVLERYNNRATDVPLSVAISDLEKKFPDPNRRLLLITGVDDVADMDRTWRLLELKTDDDVFTAQLEFMDFDGIEISPKAHRVYPYGSAAAQTIGWVGRPQKSDKELFKEDRLFSYLNGEDEVCGREDGIEYVCETVLRGRRGEIFYDIDGRRINRTDRQFGEDVSVTLDIELQQRIEQYLTDCDINPNCKAPTAVAVIEVTTGDILALVSMPVFDLNRARYDYAVLANDPNEPLRNRAINRQYPPGSVVKPLILIAGLETAKITPDEIIPCPAKPAAKGWPSCWIYNRHKTGHSNNWLNDARNAVKGSCNIYFSRLASRIDPPVLQQWLFKFGYGHKIHLSYPGLYDPNESRHLRQAQGQISNIPPDNIISRLEQLPPLERVERRYFGIGQGNLRTTPLQVANSFAAIARGGLYKPPRLFIQRNSEFKTQNSKFKIPLGISPQTLQIIRNGMRAVVSEPGGTAYNEFAYSGFASQRITVYGKTGSTEKPDNAWFAGFAEDSTGQSIAIAVVVERGQHGSRDAAPLARDIIDFCIEAEYLGNVSNITGRK